MPAYDRITFTALCLLAIRYFLTLLRILYFLLQIYEAIILIIMADIPIEVIIIMPMDEAVIL